MRTQIDYEEVLNGILLPDVHGLPEVWMPKGNNRRTYYNVDNRSQIKYINEINDILGQCGKHYVIALINDVGELYAEVVPEQAHTDIDDVMYSGDYDECYRYAIRFNTID